MIRSLSGTTASFFFYWNEGVTPGEITALSLWQSGNKLRDLSATDREITGLSWGNTYTLMAEHTLDSKSDGIAMNFRTVSKTEPTVTNDYLMGLTTKITRADLVVFRYQGLKPAWVSVDDTASAGAVIGIVGNSAIAEKADGVLLHFEVSEGDPTEFVQPK